MLHRLFNFLRHKNRFTAHFLSRTLITLWLSAGCFLFCEYATGIEFGLLRERLIADAGLEADFNDWKTLIDAAHKQPAPMALKMVNDFFNQKIKFESDLSVWNKNDYWATPMQTLSMKRGDCEDFSIAKYFTLVAAGVPEEKLRLMYVQALKFNQAHMVLAYYPSPEAEPLVLDNLNHDIFPASARSDLKPVYSLARRESNNINETHDTASRMREAMRQSRMSIWESLIKRAQAEGFD